MDILGSEATTMSENNPFNILFGIAPTSLISREPEFQSIYDSFLAESSNSQAYIITGPRGSGKTVSMVEIADRFKKMDKWLVVELNPDGDMLEQLASKLIDEGKLKKLFLKAEFNFSFKGFGFSISGSEPILNVSTLLKREFEYLTKKNYRVLITVDEVSSDQNMKVFAHEFQLLIRDHNAAYLLMTGLYKNVALLERQKNLTFLVRAPKIHLGELNKRAITHNYMNVFDIDEKAATKLTKLTNGYAFAYQLLGDILFTSGKKEADKYVLQRYDELLQERAYDLVYDELSAKEREILDAACTDPSNEFILGQLDISPNQLSNYKKGLYLKGVISSNYRKKIVFALPRFAQYLNFVRELE